MVRLETITHSDKGNVRTESVTGCRAVHHRPIYIAFAID